MNQFDIYAPSIDKLLTAFDEYVGNSLVVTTAENDYLKLLLLLGILCKRDGIYECAEVWQPLLDGDDKTRKSVISQFITNDDICATIFRTLSLGPKSIAEIKSALQDTNPYMTETLVSWMESLGILDVQQGKYIITDRDTEVEDEPVASWFQHNQDFIVPIDRYSIFEYMRKIKNGQIEMNPDFQRNLVWKPEQKCKFIESVLLNMPLPPIYLKKVSDTKFILVDGLQRSTALKDFMSDKYSLQGLTTLSNLNGCTFSNLDEKKDGLSTRLEDRQFEVYVLPPSTPMSVVYDVFNRINTGGTQLTRQEMRNCLLRGNATILLKDIARDSRFAQSIDYAIKPLRMKDREAVLRCLAFVILDCERDYQGSMDDFLENAMKKINQMSASETDALKEKALNVFTTTLRVFGPANFRIPTEYTRGRVNIAVMETIFYCFYRLGNEIGDAERLRGCFAQLLRNQTYANAVRWSTSSTAQVKERFRQAKTFFELP